MAKHGVTNPTQHDSRVSDTDMRTALETCIAIMDPRLTISLPVVKGDSFEQCLAQHGMKLPATGKMLVINQHTRTTATAVKSCAPPIPSGPTP